MTSARKLSPEVAAMHDDLLTRSPTYRLIEVIRRAGRPMTVAKVADAIDETIRDAGKRLWTQMERGRLERIAPGVYQFREGASMPPMEPRPVTAPAAPRPHAPRAQPLPTHDRAGRRVLMVLGRAPRREDCVHYDACVDIAAHVTAGDARCPTDCASYQRRETPPRRPVDWRGSRQHHLRDGEAMSDLYLRTIAITAKPTLRRDLREAIHYLGTIAIAVSRARDENESRATIERVEAAHRLASERVRHLRAAVTLVDEIINRPS